MFSFFKKKEKLEIVKKEIDLPNIEIIIESVNETPLFEDEQKQIMIGANSLLESKYVDNLEEAVITFACMFRGLKFKETEHTEDGKIIIKFKESVYQRKLQ